MTEETKTTEKTEDPSGLLDNLRQRVVSRKFMVWLTATGIVGVSHLTGTDVQHSIDAWTSISLGYIGIQGVADIASNWRRGQ